MLNRRHLRIKVLQLLYAHFQSNEQDFIKTDKELNVSLDRMYDMYLYLLLTFEQLNRAAENKMEDRKKKLRPTSEDLNPNMRFVDNQLVNQLSNSEDLQEIVKKRKVNWMGAEAQEMFRKMFNSVLESEAYVLYMRNEESGYEIDRNFMLQLFKDSVANSPWLYNFFDEKSIYWMDDLDLCCSMVLKSIKTMNPGVDFIPMPLYKDPADESTFVHDLLRKTIQNNAEYDVLITEMVDNWETERIAKMDLVLLKMGITELLYFQSIPSKVTLNEYIEISKFYSTPKSNIFINGILDKIVEKFKAEKRLVKTGRGLLD
ncbi:MAG: transcription antitermination factor NusB [Flavobacteriales bacterium]|jgi:N utilization substance protein B